MLQMSFVVIVTPCHNLLFPYYIHGNVTLSDIRPRSVLLVLIQDFCPNRPEIENIKRNLK